MVSKMKARSLWVLLAILGMSTVNHKENFMKMDMFVAKKNMFVVKKQNMFVAKNALM